MKNWKNFIELVQKSERIIISTHSYPDADGIGGQIALCLALRQLNKDTICVNEAPLLERYHYLDKERTIMAAQDYLKKNQQKSIDLLIVVDTNNLARTGPSIEKLAGQAKEILFIDHHPCPKEVAAIHCIDTTMAATGELVATFIEKLNIPFTKELALPLYTAILIDTNCFRYPNVTGNTHHVVSKLMKTGIHSSSAYNFIYGTKKIGHMQLLGEILASAQTNKNETVAWITLAEGPLKKYNADIEDTHSFINHLLVLDHIKVAMMFWEIGKHVKVSLRSSGKIDVGVMAQALGGGGHDHSAATIIEGKLEEIIKNTVRKIEMMLGQGE